MYMRPLYILAAVLLILRASVYGDDIEDSERRGKIIERVNFCCSTGACSFEDMFSLKNDAQNFLAGKVEAEESAFRKYIDTLLMGEHACKTNTRRSQDSLMSKRSESPHVDRITIPPVNVNDMVRISHLVVSIPEGYEDGVSSIYIYAGNTSSFSGYAYIVLDTPLPSVINMTFVFFTEFYVGAGVFNLTVSISDNEGFTYTYDHVALLQQNLQSTVTFAASGCAAGQFNAYNSSTGCKPCPSGSYSRKDAFTCDYCYPGQAAVGSPGTSCAVCGAGTFSTGISQCKQCPAGTFSAAGSYTCTPCAAGSFSTAGSAYCYPCIEGTYAREVGQGTCKPCPAGTYAYSGASSCTACSPGTFSPNVGATSAQQCVQCAEGTYVGVVGAQRCVGCPPGTISPRGSTSILKCFEM